MWKINTFPSLQLVVILLLFHENFASSVPKKGFLPRTKPFSLHVRGGERISQMEDYATIGFVNLMSPAEVPGMNTHTPNSSAGQILLEKNGSLLKSILTNWIDSEVTENGMESGAIVAIPHTTLFEDFGKFSRGRIKSQDYGAVLETMGCLVDSIFLLYNSNLNDRHTYIARLLKGFERQKQRVLPSGRSKVVNIFFMADGDDAVREVEALKEAIVEYEGDEGKEQWGIDVHVISFEKEVLKGIEGGNCNHENVIDEISKIDFEKSQNGDISIEIFQHLVQQIHSSLAREPSASKFEFDSVVFGIKDEVIEAQVFMDDDSGNEEQKVISAARNEPSSEESMNDSLHHRVESLSDANEATESQIEVRQQQPILNSMPSEVGELQIENSATEHVTTLNDNKEVEDPNLAIERYQDLLKVSLEELLSKARERIEKLETKQDEILLNPALSMPILEFGTDANLIFKEALDFFEELPYIQNEGCPFDLMEGKTIFLWFICYQVTVTSELFFNA